MTVTLLILAGAVVSGAVSLCVCAVCALRESEAERLELVNDARPCSRGLRLVK
jgi:hypothetical protein